jgi:hypothetical protein
VILNKKIDIIKKRRKKLLICKKMYEKLVILVLLINFLDLNSYVSCIQIDNRLVSAQHGKWIIYD